MLLESNSGGLEYIASIFDNMKGATCFTPIDPASGFKTSWKLSRRTSTRHRFTMLTGTVGVQLMWLRAEDSPFALCGQ